MTRVRQAASVVIFFISALLHELIVSIPFRNFRLLAFAGMMAQVPAHPLTHACMHTQSLKQAHARARVRTHTRTQPHTATHA